MSRILAGIFRPVLMAGCIISVGMAPGAPSSDSMAAGVPTAVGLPVVVEVVEVVVG